MQHIRLWGSWDTNWRVTCTLHGRITCGDNGTVTFERMSAPSPFLGLSQSWDDGLSDAFHGCRILAVIGSPETVTCACDLEATHTYICRQSLERRWNFIRSPPHEFGANSQLMTPVITGSWKRAERVDVRYN